MTSTSEQAPKAEVLPEFKPDGRSFLWVSPELAGVLLQHFAGAEKLRVADPEQAGRVVVVFDAAQDAPTLGDIMPYTT